LQLQNSSNPSVKPKDKAARLQMGCLIGVNEGVCHDTNVFGNTTIFFRKFFIEPKKIGVVRLLRQTTPPEGI